MKSKITSSLKEEDEPPDSLIAKTEIKQKEPVKERGSFFVSLENSKKTLPLTFDPSVFKTLQVEIASDINRCFELWKEFSPQKTLFDTWEFRFAFYQAYKHRPYFILLKNQSENLALYFYGMKRKRKNFFGLEASGKKR